MKIHQLIDKLPDKHQKQIYQLNLLIIYYPVNFKVSEQ